jgi:hypothetical protein
MFGNDIPVDRNPWMRVSRMLTTIIEWIKGLFKGGGGGVQIGAGNRSISGNTSTDNQGVAVFGDNNQIHVGTGSSQDAREWARWQAAIRDLVRLGYIKDCANGTVYELLDAGFEKGDELQKGDPAYSLSKDARVLIVAAAADRHGEVLMMRTSTGFHVQANGTDYCNTHEAPAVAHWQGVVEELLAAGALQRGGDPKQFPVTNAGFAIANRLK